VHSDEARRAAGSRGHPGYRNRRSVGGENDLGQADLVEFLEQRDLGLFVFDYRLDHEIDLAKVFEARGGLDTAENAFRFLRLDSAALDHPIEVASDILHTAPAQILADVVNQDLEAGMPRYLGDSAAHLPGT